MFYSLLLSLALAAPSQNQKMYFTFSFGSHRIETIEIKQTKLRGKERYLAQYLVDGHIQYQRLLPDSLAKKVSSDFKAILKENKNDIELAESIPCAIKMRVTEKRASTHYCADRTSKVAQAQISQWIKETRSYFF